MVAPWSSLSNAVGGFCAGVADEQPPFQGPLQSRGLRAVVASATSALSIRHLDGPCQPGGTSWTHPGGDSCSAAVLQAPAKLARHLPRYRPPRHRGEIPTQTPSLTRSVGLASRQGSSRQGSSQQDSDRKSQHVITGLRQ